MNKTKAKRFHIKGYPEGLLLNLDAGDWEAVLADLFAHIEQRSQFFAGARLAVDVGDRIIRAAQMGALRDGLSQRGVTLMAVFSTSPNTTALAKTFGIAIDRQVLEHQDDEDLSAALATGEKALYIGRTLRSGAKIDFPGHVMVYGDVNPGAEIYAQGNVIIWGRLKGSVTAGKDHDKDAVVCAIEMKPMHLCIADLHFEYDAKMKASKPEKAVIVAGQIRIVNWDK